MTTEDFIKEHRNDDVRTLALQAARYPGIDMPYALDQIAGWQTARHKLPSWAAVEGIVYPPHISMEQCSSELTARYKAPLGEWEGAFLDLTGGFGVDFSFMSRGFRRAIYVERQEHLCDTARRNFALLGLDNAEVVCADGVEYLHTVEHASLIYLDPARRDTNGARTYAISDCTPDVLALLHELLSKADRVMVKLSPMLDWHDTVDSLNAVCPDCVSAVHIVSVRNECKELLVVMTGHSHEPLTVHCANLSPLPLPQGGEPSPLNTNEKGMSKKEYTPSVLSPLGKSEVVSFSFTPSVLSPLGEPEGALLGLSPLGEWEGALYEPNASIMKAGCFAQLCERYGVRAVGQNSHLFVSNDRIDGFPGRGFRITAVSSMNKKELKKTLAGLSKANITVRNFPLTVAELRRRLKLKDGGDTYIFATTAADGRHLLFVTNKF